MAHTMVIKRKEEHKVSRNHYQELHEGNGLKLSLRNEMKAWGRAFGSHSRNKGKNQEKKMDTGLDGTWCILMMN
jgi:hypothetical protein